MRPTAVPSARPATAALRRRRHGLAAAALAAGLLVSCGSSADEPAAKTGDGTFCHAVEKYVTASEEGDRTGMADALDATVDGLPDTARKTVEAYVTALRSSPANQSPDGDGVEADATETAFRGYVQETCGDDVELPKESDATTTTAAPAGSGGGGTGDTTVDGGSMDGGSGSGGGDTGTGGGAGM